MTLRPAIFITGDCQALEVAAAAISLPAITDRFEFVHLNGLGYGDAIQQPSADQLERCIAHWRQDTPASPPIVDDLCRHVPRIGFPTTSLGVYLPFQVFDPLRPGRTWMGDRVLMDLEEADCPLTEIAGAYEVLSKEQLPSPYRLRAAQLQVLKIQEANCDLKPSEFIGSEMFRRRLFWDFDHAAPPLIAWLLGRLLLMTPLSDPAITRLGERLMQTAEDLPNTHPWHVPIPKAMRDYLSISWAGDDDLYVWDGHAYTENQYLEAYARVRRGHRLRLAAA